MFLVPSQLAPILDAVEAGRLVWPDTLKTVMLGAAPVLAPFLERAAGLLPGVRFHCIYGMTEVLPIAIADGHEKLDFASGRTAGFRTPDGAGEGDYLGEPLPGVRLRVADDHELIVSGPNMCLGYLGEDTMDEHATGDLVRLDHGRLAPGWRCGRKKDMIIRGKTNIYPGLYEPVIAGIEGVGQAVMVGVPDGIGDEAVWLAVEPQHGRNHEALLRTLRRELPKLIDESALPDRIEVMTEAPGVRPAPQTGPRCPAGLVSKTCGHKPARRKGRHEDRGDRGQRFRRRRRRRGCGGTRLGGDPVRPAPAPGS